MFYVACVIGFLALARRARSTGDALVRVVLQCLIGCWLFLPMLLIDSSDEIADRLPVDIETVRNGYLAEAMLLLGVIIAYLGVTEQWWRWLLPNTTSQGKTFDPDLAAEVMPATRGVRLVWLSAVVVLVSVTISIVFPASYEELNSIGSEAGLGGKFGLPLITPVFVAYLFGYFVFQSRRYPIWGWMCFALVSAQSGVAALEGSRIAVFLPVVMAYFRRIVEGGRLRATRWLVQVSLVLFPLGAYLLIAMAETRVGAEFSPEMLSSMPEAMEMLAIHLFIKASSVVNASVLLESGPIVTASHAITAMGGALFFFVPRLLWKTKPISGSIDGTEHGQPYRIAAELLGYPEWGNVGLSPVLTSYWMMGIVGVVGAVAVIVASLVIVRRFLESSHRERMVLAGFAFYAIGVPHMTGLWLDFAAATSTLLRLVLMGGLVRVYAMLRPTARPGGPAICGVERSRNSEPPL